MDYKKKYKQLHTLISDLYPFMSEYCKEKVEGFFPELAESESERIRKELLKFLEGIWHLGKNAPFEKWDKSDCSKWIAWLEKQGDKLQKTSIWKHWKDGIAGNGEGEPIYLVKEYNTYRLTSCLGFECDYIELSELDKLMLEKQGEQKSAAWSEEDELVVVYIEEAVINYWHGQSQEDFLDWLKSLKERIGG